MTSLTISALPHTHFFAFYAAIVDRLVALDCARLTGKYRLESLTDKRQDRHKLLAACHDLESRIEELRTAIKKETQFNRQVELNTKMKALEKELGKRIKELGGRS
jgi:flagellar motility protein MotE (MotC chaperone)